MLVSDQSLQVCQISKESEGVRGNHLKNRPKIVPNLMRAPKKNDANCAKVYSHIGTEATRSRHNHDNGRYMGILQSYTQT